MQVKLKENIRHQGDRLRVGQVVTLPDDVAQDLINKGLAVLVNRALELSLADRYAKG